MIVEKDLIDSLMEKFRQVSNFQWDFSSENFKALSSADIMISDFSSVMFDYAFLFKRPFIFVNTEMNKEIYDFSELDEIPWRFKVMREIGCELTGDNLHNLFALINEISNNKEEYLQRIENAKNYAWEEQGKSAKNVVDFLVSKQKELEEC